MNINEKDFIRFVEEYDSHIDDMVLLASLPIEEALEIHSGEPIEKQILSLNLPFGTPIYRCDYIQTCYQSEEISELEACMACFKWVTKK